MQSYDYIVIDAYNMAYRQWWAVRDFMHDGIHTGLEYGFIKRILAQLRSDPGKVYLAWDGQPVRCQTLVEGYKADRVKVNGEEAEWGPRLARLRDIFSHLCHTLYHPEEEADEQIAKFVTQNPGKRILVISNDKDLQQLVSSLVWVETSNDIFDPAGIEAKWEIPPYKIPLYKALDGDKSDNIPGVTRLRSKTKVALVNMAENIDELVSHFEDDLLTKNEKAKLAEHKEQVIKNYEAVNLLSLGGSYNLTAPDGDNTLLKEIVDELNFVSVKLE